MKYLKSKCLAFDKYNDFKICFLSIIVIGLIFLIILLSIFYEFEFISSYTGIVGLEDDYYVYVLLDDNEIIDIKNKQLVVNKDLVSYEIIKIDSEYILTDFGPKKGLYFKFNLNDDEKIVNNVLQLNFVYKKTILEKLKEDFI